MEEGACPAGPLPLPHRGGRTPMTMGRLAASAPPLDALHKQCTL